MFKLEQRKDTIFDRRILRLRIVNGYVVPACTPFARAIIRESDAETVLGISRLLAFLWCAGHVIEFVVPKRAAADLESLAMAGSSGVLECQRNEPALRLCVRILAIHSSALMITP